MKKIILPFLLLVLPILSRAQSIDEAADAYLSKLYELEKFSGSVLVAKGEEVLWKGGYGYAGIEFQEPNTSTTKFRLGSITKQFTAMAVLQLVEQGKISLEGKLTDYLPDYPADPHGDKVNVHQLLNHTSGIPSYTGIDTVMSRRGAWTGTPREFTHHFENLELEFEPGSQYRYNNSGYHLLGLIIEAVSGLSYEEYLQKNIFEPLGMSNTGVEQLQEVVMNLSNGYAAIGAQPLADGNINMDIPYAAGSMYSTVEDMHLWHQALSERKLLSAELYDKMFTPYLNNYGYGWGITEWFGRRVITHGGGIDGFSTYGARMPDENLYVIILSNLQSAPSAQFANTLAAIALGEAYEMPKEYMAVEVDPAIYDKYEGVYQLFPNFTLTVMREGDRLFTQATNQPKFEIFPESETVFFLKVVEAQVEFVPNGDKPVEKIILHQNGQHEGKRVE